MEPAGLTRVERSVLTAITLLSAFSILADSAHGQPQTADPACHGVEYSMLTPPGREPRAQWRLYVRGTGANARYYAFGLLPGDPYSTRAEQEMLRAFAIDPVNRVGDFYPTLADAEIVALKLCRAAQSRR